MEEENFPLEQYKLPLIFQEKVVFITKERGKIINL